MTLKIIAAVADNGVIGRDKDLPWRLKSDLKWFKDKTLGQHVAMGSVTFRSIIMRLGRPLPERHSMVLTRRISDDMSYPDVNFVHWWQSIIKFSQRNDVFVIGGASLYALTLPYTSELYLTRVHAEIEGDTFFPLWYPSEWERTFHANHKKSEKDQFDFTFEIHRRIGGLKELDG